MQTVHYTERWQSSHTSFTFSLLAFRSIPILLLSLLLWTPLQIPLSYSLLSNKYNATTRTTSLRYLPRYTISPESSPMAVDRTVTDNSVRTLKEIGLIPKEFLEEDLWGGESNTVIRFKN